MSFLLPFTAGLAQVGLLVLAVLRENPMFWRNQGGYSSEFRSLVHVGFWPFWLLVMTYQVFCLRLLRRHPVGWLLCLLAGLIGLLATLWAVWNNMENLLCGRPLHWHP